VAGDAEVFAGPCIDGAAAAWTEARGERVPFLGRARVLARLARNRNAVCRVVGDLAERGAAAPLAVEAVAQDDHGLGPLRDIRGQASALATRSHQTSLGTANRIGKARPLQGADGPFVCP